VKERAPLKNGIVMVLAGSELRTRRSFLPA